MRARRRGADLVERRWRKRVLEAEQVVRGVLADQVGAGGERLAELDRGGADRLEGVGIARRLGDARAEARDAREAADGARGVGIALDAGERAVAREDAAPFEQAPEMDRGGGHVAVPQTFQPLWIATRPPSKGSTLVRTNPASPIIRSKAAMSGKRRIDSIR